MRHVRTMNMLSLNKNLDLLKVPLVHCFRRFSEL